MKQLSFSQYEAHEAHEARKILRKELDERSCLRETAPKAWTHSRAFFDGRTVAVWCACDKCLAALNATNGVVDNRR